MTRSGVLLAEIGLLVYPDCQLAAVHGLTDLFRIAGEWPALDPDLPERPAIRVTHWGIATGTDPADDEAPRCIWDSHAGAPHRLDYVIAPPSIVMPDKMRRMPSAARWLEAQHATGSTVCSVCAGAFVLAESGLCEGRRVTTHWAFAKQLAERFPGTEVMEQNMVLDGGDIITAGGMLAWADLGLTLVDRLMGSGAMLATSRFLVIDPPRRLQKPFGHFVPPFDHGDEAVVRVQHHLHARLAESQTVRELAALGGLGERTFLRRFVKATGLRPTAYLQEVRIARARETLELTRRSIERIAWQVGYADPAAFRKVFQRLTGLSPALYRKRYGTANTVAPGLS